MDRQPLAAVLPCGVRRGPKVKEKCKKVKKKKEDSSFSILFCPLFPWLDFGVGYQVYV